MPTMKKERLQKYSLENLKTATEWVKKKINIDTLYDQVVPKSI